VSEGLVVHEITVMFGGIVALDELSLAVATGEVVGVIGPNGAGKTTLFNAICGFVPLRSGSISFGGNGLGAGAGGLRRHRPHDLAGLGIARTLQGVGLWHGLTVVENVMGGAETAARADLGSAMLGLPRSSRNERRLRERALAVLERLRIAEHAGALPRSLPYAVQKKAALARALVAEPRLIMLDEPASGLSAGEIEELSALVAELRGNMGVLLVEHNMDFVMSISDRLTVLNFGRVIAEGSPDAVRDDPAVTVAYLGAPVAAAGHGRSVGA
jgi:branched-chain amino acid transport system ATP-binding protein